MFDWIESLNRSRNRKAVLVTLIEHSGSSPREPGAKMLVFEKGEFEGTIGGGNLEKVALEESEKLFQESGSSVFKKKIPLWALTGQCCGGTVELLFELVNDGPQVYISGAGHVGQALAGILVDTEFRVHLIDERPEWIRHEKLSSKVQKHEMHWDEYFSDIHFSKEKTFIVVMTHNHQIDQDIIEKMTEMDCVYIGLIGSHSKWERFKQRFQHKNIKLDRFEKVHCPIGIDIGGKSPQEVAISIAAQILKEFHETKTTS